MRLQYVRPAHFQHESKDQGIAALIYLNSNIFFVLIILKETEKVEQSFYQVSTPACRAGLQSAAAIAAVSSFLIHHFWIRKLQFKTWSLFRSFRSLDSQEKCNTGCPISKISSSCLFMRKCGKNNPIRNQIYFVSITKYINK